MSRPFDPTTTRRYGRPTLPPNRLVIDNPKYDFSKLRYFHYLPGRGRTLWVEKRSIVVSIDGGARGNSNTNPDSRASYGVYFGKSSPHNRCGCLDRRLPQTNIRAEIEAAIQAVELIAQIDLTEQRTTKVVLKTNSDYLHKAMTEWMVNWLCTGGIGSKGQEVKHWYYLQELHQRIMEVEDMKGIRILFWWVPREYNMAADALADLALDRDDSAYGSN